MEGKSMKLKPLGTRIIIQPDEESTGEKRTSSGIYLPEEGDTQLKGTVVAVSEQIKDCPVEAGDRILFEKFGTKIISDDDKKYILMDVKDVLAKLTE